MGDTNIQWAEKVWNPLRGCSRKSPGCLNCYAEAVAHRFSQPGQPYEGLTHIVNGKPTWNGTIKFVEEHLMDPLRWRKPRRVFVNSMSDLFHENVSDEILDKIFAVMALAPIHKFIVLTKRAERMRAYLSVDRRNAWALAADSLAMNDCIDRREVIEEYASWPLPNVWLGVSVEDQATAFARIPLLLQTPAAVRFISAEPLLGPIDLDRIEMHCPPARIGGTYSSLQSEVNRPLLDWVIVGGESGPSARPCYLEWIVSIVEQCKASGTKVFVKQMGGNIPDGDQAYIQSVTGKSVTDRKGGDIEEFPPELRVREYPDGQAEKINTPSGEIRP
jgi:protein gp37